MPERKKSPEAEPPENRIVLRGFLRAHVLVSLLKGEVHGYGIIKRVREATGFWSPSPGTVYPLLKKLEREGLIEVSRKNRRKTYRLTSLGQRVALEIRKKHTEVRRAIIGAISEMIGFDTETTRRAFFDPGDEIAREAKREIKKMAILLALIRRKKGEQEARKAVGILEEVNRRLEDMAKRG